MQFNKLFCLFSWSVTNSSEYRNETAAAAADLVVVLFFILVSAQPHQDMMPYLAAEPKRCRFMFQGSG